MNINNAVALKMISWDSTKGEFISPARPDFIWGDEGIKSAECHKNPNHEPPQENCTCGIYATYDLIIAEEYQRRELNVLMLVESGGKTIIYTKGWRSQQLRFIAVINFMPKENPLYFKSQLACNQASDYYQLPIINLKTGLTVMDIFNTHLLSYYQPVSTTREIALDLWRQSNELKI